ncbi:alpha/beta fold hydrolase [Paenibacillus piri]|uniref:Alpha/beta fold hydrolase n=1 Tax=Paenibacillus piri TaxID=2547395 RepID=A0A4V2ZSW1_9BACL|nr:alpha/beta fold hydrolase [Paenibacillus piri]TDF94724.1 alpha/beta fold hydrolase [Paenibacillus piri]
MSSTETATLSVPGANLSYTVRGSGPVLLLIHGGNGDANVYAGIAEHLAERYTVVTYDRRGYSRSKLDNAAKEYSLETHSEDIHRLLTELTCEPAYVFGSSAGAIIGLELACHYPGQIHTLIAHEPPLTHLLSGDEQVHARHIQENLEITAQREGIVPAIRQFATLLGLDQSNGSSGRPNVEQLERLLANMNYFVMREAPAIRRHTLDLETLKTVWNGASMRIVIGGGRASYGTFPYQCAVALARQLGLEIVEFPGNHLGYVHQSQEFAMRLHIALQD